MKCLMCGKDLLPGCRSDKKYCCAYCRLKAMRKRNAKEKSLHKNGA
ncbi:hypothetical protein UVIVOLLU_CDS0066 [Salmonella phage PHA46_2]